MQSWKPIIVAFIYVFLLTSSSWPNVKDFTVWNKEFDFVFRRKYQETKKKLHAIVENNKALINKAAQNDVQWNKFAS